MAWQDTYALKANPFPIADFVELPVCVCGQRVCCSLTAWLCFAKLGCSGGTFCKRRCWYSYCGLTLHYFLTPFQLAFSTVGM
jgi:hypothetical protein